MNLYGIFCKEYEDICIERILDIKKRNKDIPVRHPHWFEEMGMCIECDSAALFEYWVANYA